MAHLEKTVYFRRCNKYCYAISPKQDQVLKQIRQTLSLKERIEESDMLMIYKGKILTPKDNLNTIDNKGIVHFIDMKDVNKQNIDIDIKQKNGASQTFTVQSSDNIGQFVAKYLARVQSRPAYHIALIALGKILHPSKSFNQEFIENGSELLMIDFGLQYAQKIATQNSNNSVEVQQKQLKSLSKDDEVNIQTHQAAEDDELPHLPGALALKVNISQVESQDSEDQHRNRVSYTAEEQQIIQKQESIRRENQGSQNLHPGDLIYQKTLKSDDVMSSILEQSKSKFRFMNT